MAGAMMNKVLDFLGIEQEENEDEKLDNNKYSYGYE